VLKDARDDARLGDSANDLAGAAAPRAPAQVDGKYPMQSGHPAHWRGAHTGLGLIVGSRFARLLGARHDARSLARIGRSRTSLCFAPPAHPCALAANRPWYLTRCALGRGASAASRAMTCTDANVAGAGCARATEVLGFEQAALGILPPAAFVHPCTAHRVVPSVNARFNSSTTKPSPSRLRRSWAMGPRAPVVYFLGRHTRSSLARSCASQATAQLSENPSRAAVNGLALAPLGCTASNGSCKRIVARPACGPAAMT